MRLHLPVSLFRALLTCFAAVAATTLGSLTVPASASTPEDELLMLLAEQEYPNGSITYTEHLYSSLTLKGYESILFKNISSSSYGGAICNYNSGTFTLSGNGDVTFSGNSASSHGGAIYNWGTFTLSGNGDVTFSGNSAYAYGGAIYIAGTFTLSGNGDVTFSGNSGGAIYIAGTFTLSGNGDVMFSGNTACNGGAIYYNSGIDGTFTLSGNGDVSFSGNSASSHGGAIYNWGTFMLSGNGDVTFSGNSASSSGGAIYNSDSGTFTLSGNGDVTFSGNSASSSGGAIYNGWDTFTLSGNGDVLFEKNAEISMGIYRLRSIYSTGTLNLSASAGKSILFRDSVYASGKVNLNNEGTGDIIFTGATTETDLRNVKGGIDGTASEILNSRTSELATLTNLYGGRLIVENGAVLKGQGITAAADSGATVRVNNGTLNHRGYALTFNAGTTFEAEGANTVIASSVNMCSGSTLSFVVGEENLTAAAMTLTGTLQTGSINLSIGGSYDLEAGHAYALLTASDYDPSAWTAENITLTTSDLSFDALKWRGGTLFLTVNPYPLGLFTFTSRLTGSQTLEGYESILFKNISSSSSGGAIYNSGSDTTFTLSDNGAVTFRGNTASSSYGGAIYNSGTFTLSDNGDVMFSEDTASSSGGAIYNSGSSASFTLSGNGDVMFRGNTASSGGAIYNSGSDTTFMLSGNGDVTFSGNSASSSSSGAIYNSGTFTLSGNGDVTFSGNSASSSSGGAIYNYYNATFTLSGNGDITFSGNTASSGGAIYNGGTFTLRENGNVVFEKNAEVQNGDYRLRSIYSSGTLNLSAAAGKNILFKDAVYASGTVNLNPDGAGDIIFSGISTETDLCEVKGGLAGTSAEISTSRSSELNAMVTLGGGTLQVRDGAVLSVKELTADESSTLVLHNGSLTISGNVLAGAVVVSGNSSIDAQDSGVLTLQQQINNNGILSLSGRIVADALSIEITDSLIATRVFCNTEGQISTDGFFAERLAGCQLTLTQGTGTIVADDAVVRISDGLLEVDSHGIARGVKGIDFGTYYLHESSERLSSILTISPDAIVQMSGGVLTVDVDRATTILHDKTSQLLFTTRQTEGRMFSAYDELLFRNMVPASSRYGGAMFSQFAAVTIENNRYVEYARNAAEMGGAVFIDDRGSFILSQNEAVSFIGNVSTLETPSVTSFSCFFGGGAIASDGNVVLSGNDQLRFCDNAAARYGGAIYSDHGPFSIENNNSVIFSGNSAGLSGGAIYNLGTLELKGNGDVLFEKNAEIQDGAYRLRSIYSANGSHLRTPVLYLSAPAGHSVRFYDSVFAEGEVHFNSEGSGDIIFSGATTESDLLELKGEQGSAEEILNSRTSEIATMTYLYGGRLVVEDKAILKGQGITATADSGATVRVNNGVLEHGGYELTFNKGTTLEAEGICFVSGGVSMNEGSTLSFVIGEVNKDEAALTLDGTLRLESIAISIRVLNTQKSGSGTYVLLHAADYDGTSWSESLVTVTTEGVTNGDLVWKDGNLLLTCSKPDREVQWSGSKGTISADSFVSGDSLKITSSASITLKGELEQGGIVVNSSGKVVFTADKKTPSSSLGGDGTVSKYGIGTLTLNGGNSYTGGTTLYAGILKATAADSFGTGVITVKGGTLDLGGKAVANDIVLSGKATLTSDAKYVGNVSVDGNATLLAKTSYKGMTTIGEGSTLTLAEKATMAGSIAVDGTLRIRDAKGLTLAKGATMTLDKGGAVRGLLTVGAGSTLVWADGGFETAAPVLKGGTLDLGAKNSLTLTGSKAQVAFGDKRVELPGKGVVYTDETLTVDGGTVTLSALSGYDGSIEVAGGTLKLATGKVTTDNEIVVSGNAAVVNGKTHLGNITVNGTLAKGSNITIADGKTVELNGAGIMLGTIAGAGTVDVNASIDATAAKITAAHINLNSGTYTNEKGIKLAKGQTLTLGGVALNLGPKGALATAAGSTLTVNGSNTLSGNLTLGGGELVFNNGSLAVEGGTLTLSKAMTVRGSGVITYAAMNPFKGDIAALFGGADVKLNTETGTLTFNGGVPKMMSLGPAPLDSEPVAWVEATEKLAPAPLDAAPAPMPAANPVADAVVQADWGIIDAERAFLGAVNSRHQHAALLDKGRGAAWVSAFGAAVRHGNKGAHHGSDGNIEGAAFGLEHAVSETGSIGLAVGRSKNRIAATGVTHLRQETAHVALYGQKQLAHGFTADAAASYGDTETKLGAASWQQKSAALTARLTHAQQLTDATAFRTFGGLSYEATDKGSIGTAHSGSVQNVRGELGAGITHRAGRAHLYAEAALTGDMVRHDPTVDLDGTRTHGANPGRIGVRATIGGLYEFTDTWSGTASYGIEAESRSTAHTLNIGVSKTF